MIGFRKTLLILLSAACAASAAISAYLGTRVEDRKLPGKVELVPATYDFGAVSQNSELVGKIRIQNGTLEPVTITNIAKSCSCSETIVEPATIPPGEAGELTVKWKVGKRRGRTGETLILLYSTPTYSPQPLHAKITADVSPAVECSIDTIRFDEKTTKQTVTIRGTEGHAVKLAGAASNHGSILIKCDPEKNEVEVEFDEKVSGWELGNLSVTLLTGCTVEPEIQIPVTISNNRSRK